MRRKSNIITIKSKLTVYFVGIWFHLLTNMNEQHAETACLPVRSITLTLHECRDELQAPTHSSWADML